MLEVAQLTGGVDEEAVPAADDVLELLARAGDVTARLEVAREQDPDAAAFRLPGEHLRRDPCDLGVGGLDVVELPGEVDLALERVDGVGLAHRMPRATR